MIFSVAKAFGLEVSYFQIVFLTSVINIATLVPSSPGYFGTFEFFTWQALVLFGIPKTEAITFGALLHLVQWAPITLIGYLYSFRYHVHFRNLSLTKQEE